MMTWKEFERPLKKLQAEFGKYPDEQRKFLWASWKARDPGLWANTVEMARREFDSRPGAEQLEELSQKAQSRVVQEPEWDPVKREWRYVCHLCRDTGLQLHIGYSEQLNRWYETQIPCDQCAKGEEFQRNAPREKKRAPFHDLTDLQRVPWETESTKNQVYAKMLEEFIEEGKSQ
jgi:hypothetical protein